MIELLENQVTVSVLCDQSQGNRKVIMCNIPGAFMQVDIDKVIFVHRQGPLAQLLTKVDLDLYANFQSKKKMERM